MKNNFLCFFLYRSASWCEAKYINPMSESKEYFSLSMDEDQIKNLVRLCDKTEAEILLMSKEMMVDLLNEEARKGFAFKPCYPELPAAAAAIQIDKLHVPYTKTVPLVTGAFIEGTFHLAFIFILFILFILQLTRRHHYQRLYRCLALLLLLLHLHHLLFPPYLPPHLPYQRFYTWFVYTVSTLCPLLLPRHLLLPLPRHLLLPLHPLHHRGLQWGLQRGLWGRLAPL